MNRIRTALIIVALTTGLIFVTLTTNACKKEKASEGELITKVTLILDNGTFFDTVIWSDPDGAGGNPPLNADTLFLDSGKFVKVTISFGNNDEDLTGEIKTEGNSHIVCIDAGGIITGSATDSDGTHPIGLEWTWYGNKRGNGKVNLSLKHQPGVKDGTCSPGETDVSVDFPLLVK